MNGLARWVPRLMIAMAVLHFVWAVTQPNSWSDILHDGFVATAVDPDTNGFDAREATVWFMTAGLAFLALGTLARHVVRATGSLPPQVGWYLLGIGIPLCAIYFPTTGSWSMPVIGVLALMAAREPDRRHRRTGRRRPRDMRPPGAAPSVPAAARSTPILAPESEGGPDHVVPS
ncbi:DUF6463 family protein [Streptomyces sp. NPDC006314]|uniref:DUF6463 family protein n=1 Tax=Streptomyces sp. NPDC006314 TaxID=3154475 RepID=UPI0033BE9302